jgi:hypothetical protein
MIGAIGAAARGTAGFLTGNAWWLAAIAAVAGSLYGYGYYQGSTGELRRINEAKDAELAQAVGVLETFHNEAITIMRDVAATNAELDRNVQKISRPTTSKCDLGPDWLRALTDSVRAANSAGASARTHAPAPGAGQ